MTRLKQVGVKVAALTEDQVRDPETLVQLVWACLLHEDPTLTIETVAGLIDASAYRLPDLMALVVQAMERGLIREVADRPTTGATPTPREALPLRMEASTWTGPTPPPSPLASSGSIMGNSTPSP